MRLKRNKQTGFSVIEVLVATVILYVGIAAVAELVPRAMRLNLTTRYDSSAVVIAERMLDQMISQPLTSANFVNSDGLAMSLGGVAGQQGNPLTVAGGRAMVNWLPVGVAGYSLNYSDPDDSTRSRYEIRWTVITSVQAGTVVSKRFIVGVWKRDPRTTSSQVTIEAIQQR